MLKIHSALLISLGIVIGAALAFLTGGNVVTLLIAGGLTIVSLVTMSIMVRLSRNPGEKTPVKPAAVATQAKGTVKWFNYKKGFGFIQQENGEDVFVHHNSIVSGKNRALREGQKVSMDIVQGTKGLQAENVSLL